jgi:flagellar protein FliS
VRDPDEQRSVLRRLYAYLVLRLTQANLRNDDDALDECRGLVLPLQQAWASIAPQADAAAARGER